MVGANAFFPKHGSLTEEEGAGRAIPGPVAPPTWIVDPIEGTTNYVHNFPFYCISIGLQIRGEMVVGIALDPTRSESFVRHAVSVPGLAASI
jgi:myo-inositol-1(or 4)-monophosphatase